MAISDVIETRVASRVVTFLKANEELFALLRGAGPIATPTTQANIQLGSFSADPAGGRVTPRQINVYPGDARKVPGVTAAWKQGVDILIEFIWSRNQMATEQGVKDCFNEAKYLVNQLYIGESGSQVSGRVPGKLKDPANLAVMITEGIENAVIDEPRILPNDAGIVRLITVTYITREDAAGASI